MRGAYIAGMRCDPMCWRQHDERTWTMELPSGAADWIEVKVSDQRGSAAWRVDACLNGSHYRVRDAFQTREAAQGCALLLAMRLASGNREALHAQLDVLQGAWWWKILPGDDAGAERRSIFSSRVSASEEDAERSGRAAGAGWYLYVYGPGSVRSFGQLPR